MVALQIFYRRNRQLIIRVGAVAVVTICGLLALAPMPGSGANRTPAARTQLSGLAMLLSPYRLETEAFVAEYLAIFR